MSTEGVTACPEFERHGKLEDLERAISKFEAVANVTLEDDPNLPGILSNLGLFLRYRFEQLGRIADINESIERLSKAAGLTGDNDPEKLGYSSSLGSSLIRRFERLGAVGDMNNAIIHLQMARNHSPTNGHQHPSKPIYLSNLGNAFQARFIRFHDRQDAKAAILSFSTSAQSSVGPPIIRFRAAQRWISIASPLEHESLLLAYECAVRLMPLVAWLGLSIADRHEHLVQIGGIARDAAAIAISLEQCDKAVEWLEQGRSIVWNQILQLRTPVDELRIIDLDLADRLMQVSQLLNRGVERNEGTRSIEEEGQRYRALTIEWESIIEQVRSLPNFQDFLKPPQISRLRDAAQYGPVVVVNIAEKRCDALALVPGLKDILHIPLPEITYERAAQLQTELRDVLYSSGMRTRGDRAARRVTDEGGKDCKGMLAEIWNGLVKPVLDSLAFSV
ncbi:hypothetical protein CPB86DRAFT_718845, partial [Serendipita vermifera]